MQNRDGDARLLAAEPKEQRTGTLVYLSVNSDAIEVSFATKREGLKRILRDCGIAMKDVAVIGDGENDLPFLLDLNVRLAAVPANGQSRVKDSVAGLQHGIILKHEGLEGFLAFYEGCRRSGVRLIISDRDGVLRWKNDAPLLPAFRDIYSSMGTNGNPVLVVLTGSSAEQNYRFVGETGIAKSVSVNPQRKDLPPLIYAENGSVVIDISWSTYHIGGKLISQNDLDVLLGGVRTELLDELRTRILPQFGMSFSRDESDQVMNVCLPEKIAMLTVNVPKTFTIGDFFRDSPEAQRFRNLVASVMETALRRHDFQVSRL